MINFFRKIRKQMADDNKPLKYMRYAVGEIVLVVIGILIALQINNINEERKEEVLEIQFLKRIEKDLIADTIYFNRRIKLSQETIDNHYLYIHNAYKHQNDRHEFTKLINLLNWNSEHFISQNSTFQELLNTGQLNILKNQELKENLITLYKDYNIASSHIKEYNEFSSTQMGQKPFSFSKYWGSYSVQFDEPYMFHKDEWDYINNPNSQNFKFIEYLASVYANKNKDFLDYFKKLHKKAELILNDVDRELRNR